MAIYTKTGDKGETGVFGGQRVSKASAQMEACGTIDELTSSIGYLITKVPHNKTLLLDIQKSLYEIMGFLAGAHTPLDHLNEMTNKFEKKIDAIEAKLPKLHRFILPGGSEAAALTHITRTICRRTERAVVRYFILQKTLQESQQQIILKYLNRLSDLFFDMAREYNKGKDIVT